MEKVAHGYFSGSLGEEGFHEDKESSEKLNRDWDTHIHDMFGPYEGQEIEVFVRRVKK